MYDPMTVLKSSLIAADWMLLLRLRGDIKEHEIYKDTSLLRAQAWTTLLAMADVSSLL